MKLNSDLIDRKVINYYSDITQLLSGLSAQSNSVSQIIINNEGQVTFNVTLDITTAMNLNSNTVIFIVPTQVKPTKNIVLNGKLYHSTNQNCIFGNAYMRSGTREVVVNFNTSNIPVNSVITITGDYYIS